MTFGLYGLCALPVFFASQDWFDAFPNWCAERRAQRERGDSPIIMDLKRHSALIIGFVLALALGFLTGWEFQERSMSRGAVQQRSGLFPGKIVGAYKGEESR